MSYRIEILWNYSGLEISAIYFLTSSSEDDASSASSESSISSTADDSSVDETSVSEDDDDDDEVEISANWSVEISDVAIDDSSLESEDESELLEDELEDELEEMISGEGDFLRFFFFFLTFFDLDFSFSEDFFFFFFFSFFFFFDFFDFFSFFDFFFDSDFFPLDRDLKNRFSTIRLGSKVYHHANYAILPKQMIMTENIRSSIEIYRILYTIFAESLRSLEILIHKANEWIFLIIYFQFTIVYIQRIDRIVSESKDRIF